MRGFLYYHLAPNVPALSGQVRLRITGSSDPALASSGEDLLRTDHLPWRIPVTSLVHRKRYKALFRRMLDDGLLSEHVLRAISSLPPGTTQVNARSSRISHALGQPFLLRFGVTTQPFNFIGADTVLRANSMHVTMISNGHRSLCAPTIRGATPAHYVQSTASDCLDVFLGSALCRFEKSARPEHTGRRIVVYRVVRIVEPMERTALCNIADSLMPREGELLSAVLAAKSERDREWSFDVDRCLSLGPDTSRYQFAAGLALLYDNEARARGLWAASQPPTMSTLNHTRLTSDNFLVLSGLMAARARAYRPLVPGPGSEHWRFVTFLLPTGMHNFFFPSHSRGYLYYHIAPNAPALSGQVRFRVTGINDPALFSSGEDLLRADYLPWRIPVIFLPFRNLYTAMLQRLVEDGLVSEHLSRIASSLSPEARRINIGSTRIVHAFGQPFLLTFGLSTQPFYFIGADTVLHVFFPPVAIARDLRSTERRPTITGSALCCFEKSTRPEHAGRRVVVCRVIRIVKPMRLTGFRAVPQSSIPREGELLRTNSLGDLEGPEWAFDVGHRSTQLAAGLSLLYDNELRAGGPVGW
ncbi:uncharacterized protein TRAVEDRAFT_68880 [Trametes versicolor FP-101664 SS1]|uniref:uncharacterized protein n=1 Tax=Trametes versicolor (strain FP-101664) TaxID=717944 RepID=UPI00046219EA|nr:uncharacterized protein TRAVEDRAFT_68880 [Trametes versicolor FP-101664 SS1]EIW62438.1 hypothetical protein TRAVEDRAFT_68880 [Trametes versicolor FP-101664 SS1]